jgi:DNA modification methylase
MKQQLKLHKIKSNPNNPRIIKNDKFKKLVHSIIDSPAFMELRPVIIDVDSMVIGGNMRLKAHHHLNRKEVWTDMFTQEMSDKMNVLALEEGRKTKTYLEYCQAFTIKDNVSSGEWEYDMLANEWDSVQLAEWGLDVWENQDDVKEGLIEDNEIPEVKESKVKRGDIWQLGEHRVMCGDSTSSDDVAKLMNGEKADMVFTDPPYRMEAEGGSNQIVGKAARKLGEAIKHLCDFNPIDFLNTLPFVFNKNIMNAYIFCNKDLVPDYLNYAIDSGYSFNILVWKKPNAIPLGGSHRPDVEYLLLFRKAALWNNGVEGVNYSRCLEYGREKGLHPTMKPIDLITNEMLISSNKKSVCVDFFLGSGSTLIAAEKLKRKCYGMELDEKYCDVIINRWEQFTGLKAIKNGTE